MYLSLDFLQLADFSDFEDDKDLTPSEAEMERWFLASKVDMHEPVDCYQYMTQ